MQRGKGEKRKGGRMGNRREKERKGKQGGREEGEGEGGKVGREEGVGERLEMWQCKAQGKGPIEGHTCGQVGDPQTGM